ncbi:50S ribosomal protein L23 [Brevibacillus sp. 7WMA2]|uniref:Large ribosomal subunit protein uL23 n=3 Tax=Brevibacillus TaxID=55080 RepID=A0A075QZE4_BRELA|nr:MULTISPECIES: 50S ribosomal protein L23 [Brevibacillus]AIG24591.1 50S ribosomal protein L23 [Brevibacillus laterosporus LMG 15441]AKF94173.1 50S ribosomal protein L23 [Brevibacillus laterosporus]ATO49568.1 50S ribosomal protein L23 [Brevibacillus laterosporus DSM 25]AUM63238.1 50S ribosomal protein L23 [Brevibacillus laterosporus]AYB40315.1 50S ribosomal protein L23 [Brevibacillus laterosporus]
MKSLHDVIKRPIITERTTDMMADKKYVFEVPMKANKTEIKQAIEKVFGVKVEAVNTIRVAAKPKRYGKYAGYTSEWKKAIVKLTADSKELEFYEGI